MADSSPAPVPAAKPVLAEKPAKKPRAPLSDASAGRIATVVHILLALGAGWLAPQFRNDLIGGIIGLVLLVAVGYPLTILLGRKGIKWWLQNGLIVYLFLFFVGWAWMLNA